MRCTVAGFAGVLSLAALLGCAPSPKPEALGALGGEGADLEGVDRSPLRGRRILIDPGHGGRFGGTAGPAGTREADVNLGVALHLWGLLRDAGAEAHLTRSSDRDFLGPVGESVREDLQARAAAIDSLDPEVFLSIHHNSSATLDRSRNALELYYKLDDEDGPSYELAQALAARLEPLLDIPDARILPGNYFVLRAGPGPAVLGEACYLSHPEIESRLRLAEKQRLEAQAYFLGLVDYFAHGSAALVRTEPAGDTLGASGVLRFAAAEPLDPRSIEVRAGRRELPAAWDAARGDVLAAACVLPPGAHAVQVRARLARGNPARPWRGTVVVAAVPARVVLAQEPDPVRPGGRARLHLAVQDSLGRPLGDGVPVALDGEGIEVIACEPAVQAGVVWAQVRVRGGAARIRLHAAARTIEAPLRVEPGGGNARFARCVDARTGGAIADVTTPDGSARSDRSGWLPLPTAVDSLALAGPGYLPWQGKVAADSTLRLEPRERGRFQDVRVAIDPGTAGAASAAPSAWSAPETAHRAGVWLAERLRAAGALSLVVRARGEPAADLLRVQRATRYEADWYLRIEPGAEAAVRFAPASGAGERLAREIAAALERESGLRPAVASEASFVLLQTACPAVVVVLPASLLADAERTRGVVAALGSGLRRVLDPESAALPPLVGRAPAGALVVLDGGEIAAARADGSFRFEAVAPGTHCVRLLAPERRPPVCAVVAGDTLRIDLTAGSR